MGTPRFDPTHSLEFNFDRGTVKLGGQSDRVLVPADVLASLLKGADLDTNAGGVRSSSQWSGRRFEVRVTSSSPVSSRVRSSVRSEGARRCFLSSVMIRS
jgi:hypothetical protein